MYDKERGDKLETQIKDYTLKNKKNFQLSLAQNEIVDALLKNDYFYNAAQTGLGKTLSTLTAAVHKAVERKDEDIHFILLLPGPAVQAFRNTLTNILGLSYNIFTATTTRVQEGAIFSIFNYSSLRSGVIDKKGNKITGVNTNKYIETLKYLKSKHDKLWLIADEAHVLQDPNTTQYMLIQALRPLFIGMWFLTATPILNDLEGFFHMTELTHPGFWGNIYKFKNKFQVMVPKTIYVYNKRQRRVAPKQTMEVTGYKNLDLLKAKFNEIGIIRAKQYNLNFIYRTTKLRPGSESHYKLAAKGLFSGTVNKKSSKKDEVQHGARLHDLQRVVSNSHKDFHYYKDDELSEKEELLMRTIMEVIERDEAVLVYFTYRESLERVKQLLLKIKQDLNIPTVHEIHGDISQQKRVQVEKGIKPRDVVLITSAGTESVNLQKANNLIFYEVPFAIRQFIQACGRITRTDTEFNEFDVYILEAENTIDTYKKNRIIANSEVIKSVLGGSNALPTEMLQISLEDIQAMKDELLWRK